MLDLGVQGIHISNQSAIYALAPEARSRLTTAYMVSYFSGGAALSAITSVLYSSNGWDGVCVVSGRERASRVCRCGRRPSCARGQPVAARQPAP